MAKPKPSRSQKPAPDDEEKPTFARARIDAQRRRAQKMRAQDDKIIKKLLEQLGVSHKELDARADADFEQAKEESAQRLTQLRVEQSARLKERGSLRSRIEGLYTRFRPTEVTK